MLTDTIKRNSQFHEANRCFTCIFSIVLGLGLPKILNLEHKTSLSHSFICIAGIQKYALLYAVISVRLTIVFSITITITITCQTFLIYVTKNL